jgi:hypothetical protein
VAAAHVLGDHADSIGFFLGLLCAFLSLFCSLLGLVCRLSGSLLKEEEVPTPSVTLAAGSSYSVPKPAHTRALSIYR